MPRYVSETGADASACAVSAASSASSVVRFGPTCSSGAARDRRPSSVAAAKASTAVGLDELSEPCRHDREIRAAKLDPRRPRRRQPGAKTSTSASALAEPREPDRPRAEEGADRQAGGRASGTSSDQRRALRLPWPSRRARAPPTRARRTCGSRPSRRAAGRDRPREPRLRAAVSSSRRRRVRGRPRRPRRRVPPSPSPVGTRRASCPTK